jgi:hypothetical protein
MRHALALLSAFVVFSFIGSGVAGGARTAVLEASFAERSYAPGSLAVLQLRGASASVRIGVYRAGAGHRDGPMQGSSVGATSTHRPAASLGVPIGDWPSGFYYARVSSGKNTWIAPFVVRPKRMGEHRVLVVLPTNTWQAYNYEDGDSWYANAEVHTVDLSRPFIDGGVPPHYHGYDRGFLRWLVLHDHATDFYADDDLERVAHAEDLARAYDLIVFPGHEEYVTGHAYGLIERYRDLGGNLAFMSSNDFFYKVVKRGNQMDGRWRWRDLGRPEASVVGEQYVDWNHNRYPNRPYLVTGVEKAPWFFANTGLHDGDTFGIFGIEVDARAAVSPRSAVVLAHIPNIFGRGTSAEMTFYRSAHGAQVFSAGVMNFGGSALLPAVSAMMENLWGRLARP